MCTNSSSNNGDNKVFVEGLPCPETGKISVPLWATEEYIDKNISDCSVYPGEEFPSDASLELEIISYPGDPYSSDDKKSCFDYRRTFISYCNYEVFDISAQRLLMTAYQNPTIDKSDRTNIKDIFLYHLQGKFISYAYYLKGKYGKCPELSELDEVNSIIMECFLKQFDKYNPEKDNNIGPLKFLAQTSFLRANSFCKGIYRSYFREVPESSLYNDDIDNVGFLFNTPDESSLEDFVELKQVLESLTPLQRFIVECRASGYKNSRIAKMIVDAGIRKHFTRQAVDIEFNKIKKIFDYN